MGLYGPIVLKQNLKTSKSKKMAKEDSGMIFPDLNEDPKESMSSMSFPDPEPQKAPAVPGGNIEVDISGKVHRGVIGFIEKDGRGIHHAKVAWEKSDGNWITILLRRNLNPNINDLGLKNGSIIIFEVKKTKGNRWACINTRKSDEPQVYEDIYDTIMSLANPSPRTVITTFMGWCMKFAKGKAFLKKNSREPEFATRQAQAGYIIKEVLKQKNLTLVGRTKEKDFSLLFR